MSLSLAHHTRSRSIRMTPLIQQPSFNNFTMSRFMNRRGTIVLFSLCCLFALFFMYGLQPSGKESPLQASSTLRPAVRRWFNYSHSDVQNLNSQQVKPDDPSLIEHIRHHFLLPPPAPGTPYHLHEPYTRDPSMGQSEKIVALLKNKTGGFFVECGALDGETRSNTLFLERYLNWSGLLVEADPINFSDMMDRQRQAWLSPACLSLQGYPTMVSFEQKQNQGRISETLLPGTPRAGFVDVQCLPLWSLLLALNRTTVDYFSLDVEGHELDVLRTIPFSNLDIKTLSVEFIHGKDGKEALRSFMENQGYRVDSEVTHPNWLANDYIFVKKELR